MAANDDANIHDKRKPIRDGIDGTEKPGDDVGAKSRSATDRTRDGLRDARERAAHAYSDASRRATDALGSARGSAADARQRATSTLEKNPLAAALGGVALGIVVGALLPRTQKESELYGFVGARIAEAARAATVAAREAGRDRLNEMGLNRENAGNSVKSVVDAALSAATATRSPTPVADG